MSNKVLLHELKEALYESIEEGRLEVKNNPHVESSDQQTYLEEITIYHINQFRHIIFSQIDTREVTLTREEIEHLCKQAYECYYCFKNAKKVDYMNENSIQEFHYVVKAFYSFCFDAVNAKQILGNSPFSQFLKMAINSILSSSTNISILRLKNFAKKIGINIMTDESATHHTNYFTQSHKSISFELKTDTYSLNVNGDYLMILSNNFAEFERKYLPLTIATKYIIRISDAKPVAIYVVVKTPIMSSTILRSVRYDGSSSNLGRLDSDDVYTVAKFINALSN